jgi:hypothetical protein
VEVDVEVDVEVEAALDEDMGADEDMAVPHARRRNGHTDGTQHTYRRYVSVKQRND